MIEKPLSIVILTHKRPAALRRCLESLERCRAAQCAEVWIGFNGLDRGNPGLIQEISRRFPWTQSVELRGALPGHARNQIILRTSGSFVYFLDDDVQVPNDFISRVLAKFTRHPQAPVIGGPNLAPPDSSDFQRAADWLFGSPLGAGPARIRYRRTGKDRVLPSWSFTLSNLGVRREVFTLYSLRFPDYCVTAEENLFLYDVERRLGSIVYSPDLYVYHERRGNLRAFCRQLFGYGKGRMQITKSTPTSLQAAVLFPVALVFYLFSLPFLTGRPMLFLPLGIYGLGCIFETLRFSLLKRDWRAARWLPLLFPLFHGSYAAGLLWDLATGKRRPSGADSVSAPELAENA